MHHFDGVVVVAGEIVSHEFVRLFANIKEAGGCNFSVATCWKLVNKLPCHVLVTEYGEPGLIHVPAEGGVAKSSHQ